VFALANRPANKALKANQPKAKAQLQPWNYAVQSATVTYYSMQNCLLNVALDITIKNVGMAYPESDPAPTFYTWGRPLDPYLSNTNVLTGPKLATSQQTTFNTGMLRSVLLGGSTDTYCVDGSSADPSSAQSAGAFDLKLGSNGVEGLWLVRWGGSANPTITVLPVEPPPPDPDYPWL
jgi:hypothetical protein